MCENQPSTSITCDLIQVKFVQQITHITMYSRVAKYQIRQKKKSLYYYKNDTVYWRIITTSDRNTRVPICLMYNRKSLRHQRSTLWLSPATQCISGTCIQPHCSQLHMHHHDDATAADWPFSKLKPPPPPPPHTTFLHILYMYTFHAFLYSSYNK